MNKLSQSTIEKLGYYVYLLIEPRTGQSFYVGKGCGNRINYHLLGALEINKNEKEKIRTIRDIQSNGLNVGIVILRHGITEKEAFEVKKIKDETEDAVFEEPVILLNVRNQFSRGISASELYKITKGNWGVDLNRVSNITIVCAVALGIVIEVYIPKAWLFLGKVNKKGNKLYYFEGKIAPQKIREKYLHKSVARFWKKGSRSPIKYEG